MRPITIEHSQLRSLTFYNTPIVKQVPVSFYNDMPHSLRKGIDSVPDPAGTPNLYSDNSSATRLRPYYTFFTPVP